MRNTNLAYDLEVFEYNNDKAIKKKPAAESSSPSRVQKARPKSATLRVFLCMLLVQVTASCLIFSYVQVAEVSNDINQAKNELAVLQADANRLELALEQSLSMKNIQVLAETQLGMVKLESGQIQYITIEGGDQISLPIKAKASVWEKILTFLMGKLH